MLAFIIIFLVLLAFIGLMAVGIMFRRKPITGSCGGLGNVGIEKACGCDKPCDEKVAKDAEIAKKQATAEIWHKED